MRTARRLYRRAMLFILDIHPPWWGRAWLWAAIALVPLYFYGVTAQFPAGPVDWVRPVVGAFGLALLIAAALVGKLRRLVRHGHADRLTLVANHHCPRCEYPLSGLPTEDTCPECGLDISTDTKASRRELAR